MPAWAEPKTEVLCVRIPQAEPAAASSGRSTAPASADTRTRATNRPCQGRVLPRVVVAMSILAKAPAYTLNHAPSFRNIIGLLPLGRRLSCPRQARRVAPRLG